ncbi:MAG: UDP-N-acetylmuramoyl-tripeptide--D-alanyl-D-alanine ligase [Actinomycetota bacterium]|nr:UDP-N-acetylmuramoyl-tripeptide--D-alanyl-D-alanine ligase [Actinomycetota bacterium]
MIPMTLRDVADLTGGSVHPDTAEVADLVVDGPVVTDSREAGPGSLYVARVGEHADGHAYAGAAQAAGAVAALTSRVVDGVPCIVVDDVQVAFGRLARAVVDRSPDLRVVAITGSSGKTSTKDLLAQVLASAGETVAPAASLNGEIGVPLTVCRVTPTTRFLVAEMGARSIGHLAYLTTVAPPDVSIVLNVGVAHVGEFGSREAIAQAKGELVEALGPDGVAVLNADDPAVAAMAARTRGRVVTVGLDPSADVRAADVRLDASGRASFTVSVDGASADVALRVSGGHQVGNALAVVAAGVACGMDLADVANALSDAAPLSRWRMEIHERPDQVTVVNDAYNANPGSMRAALEALGAIAGAVTPRRRCWAVLGEMLELGDESRADHEEVGRAAVELGVDRLVVVGEGARPVADGAGEAQAEGERAAYPTETSVVADADAAFALLTDQVAPGDVVLLKSSRDSGLRWLGDRLVGLEVPT